VTIRGKSPELWGWGTAYGPVKAPAGAKPAAKQEGKS